MMYLSEFSREIQPVQGTNICLFIYFKVLAHEIVAHGKSEICRQADRLETQADFDAAVLMQNFFGKLQVLLLRSSTDWMKATYSIRDNLLYLSHLMVDVPSTILHLQNAFIAIPRLAN